MKDKKNFLALGHVQEVISGYTGANSCHCHVCNQGYYIIFKESYVVMTPEYAAEFRQQLLKDVIHLVSDFKEEFNILDKDEKEE